MRRVALIVLDSVGVGELPDAARFGDVGSNTLGNIARVVGGLSLPNMERMGLGNIVLVEGVRPSRNPTGGYGKMAEISAGKDTTTGHWELMGVISRVPFPTYPNGFPSELMDEFAALAGKGWLGNKPASGTEIIQELGEEHLRTGRPIVYTSGDSVFQIAAHEAIIPVRDLYQLCRHARGLLRGKHEVGRVIARPFIGTPGSFRRTVNRKDFSVMPPKRTVLDLIQDGGLRVHAVGKIEDIFAGQGISHTYHTTSNMDGVDQILRVLRDEQSGGLVFANLVDFDALYGHRNDPDGYAAALQEFDARVPELQQALRDEDVLIITADHGNDPTMPGTDHTREYVPVLISGKTISSCVNIGMRDSFADMGASITELLGVTSPEAGVSFAAKVLTKAH